MDRVGITVAPGDVEPAFGALGEALERITIDCMDRHTSARRYDADDAVPGEWVATAGKMQRHAGDQAADRYRHLVAFRRAPRLCKGHDRRLDFLRLRAGGVDDRTSVSVPLADGDIKILDGRVIEVLEHRLERTEIKLLGVLMKTLVQDGK